MHEVVVNTITEGFWDLPLSVNSDAKMYDNDGVMYNAESHSPLREFLKKIGVRHILLTGCATVMCFCRTMTRYKKLFQEGQHCPGWRCYADDVSHSNFSKHAANVHVAFAVLSQLIVQVCWIRDLGDMTATAAN